MKNNQVQVGPFNYTVVCDRGELNKEASPEEKLVGYCDHHNQRLVIDGSQSTQMMKETILHEFLHACFFTSGLSCRLEQEENLEEWIISALSPILYDCFLRNRAFFKELMK